MTWFDCAENWITNHLNLVTAIGVPILIVMITAWISLMTARANNKAADRQRDLTHQLKLADFRQAWINDMRNDFAIYTVHTWDESLNEGAEAKKERVAAQARILMRMNENDPDYEALLASLLDPVARPEEDHRALFEIGRRVLKREWERLKDDIADIEKNKRRL
jgi:hypothetical protein